MSDLIKDINFVGDDVDKKAVSCDMKITEDTAKEGQRKLYIESYGCQMNFSDSEIVASVMQENNFGTTKDVEEADLVFLNTCSIREKAELTVRKRLTVFNKIKKRKPGMIIGVLGCMAERLKTQLLEEEKMVDIVAGPDSYRDLPKLVGEVDEGDKGVNVFLSRDETYADIAPVRLNSNGITALISIMRGCDNMCSFCVVPYTRGRERSRDPHSIVKEAQELFDQGYKEVTLLGQNVDSYKWSDEENNKARLEKKEKSDKVEEVVNFANLLEMVAKVSPELRIRFSTSHPKDITDDVLYTIKKYENICKFIHLPVQSGNSRILDLMNRTYDREWYINRIDKIREILGDECGVSSDMISGFCSETEEEHQDTLSLMEYVEFDFSYMFFYSERPGTLAEKKLEDDIPEVVKRRRLQEIVDLQRKHAAKRNALNIGQTQKVLIEGVSKRSEEHFQGRNSQNKVIVFPKGDAKIGTYANVKVHDCTTGTLLGTIV
ncbi:tRNA (N6-isopentenyl adenosine(37)-C2)-methylthiotransferase MiaB [Flammeovirga pacifica]|uniref:tRNA-2-methylthio-N(6)-dimethylallyladenosine synthase n=1 Tax=Flammeovirga pacifica TaxID=915059 RepID=A0A1S1Z2Z1_FLAPC|nr:tRNA (N6-isopentenyl adenosine(37)-C2)-methylthiotransferase MiaB [Flammeovirga pacifica]OHX67611.1 tRNA (N6-isopentenyl adenosine(37)-C2)-methylthiotransferase MiaB [Flammeovirga pacifica]